MENPNDVAAAFIDLHSDWQLILDDDGDVLLLASPFYSWDRSEEDSN